MKLCKCGCGMEVKWNKQQNRWNKFLLGHTWKNKKRPEHSKKMSGNNNPMKRPEVALKISRIVSSLGELHHMKSPEMRERVSKVHSGKVISEKTKAIWKKNRKGKRNANYGNRFSHSLKTKMKISKSLKGRIFSEEHKRKIGNAHKGRVFSEETLKRMKVAQKKLRSSGEFVKRWLRSCRMKPNKKERKLNLILRQLFLSEYKLNVQGDVIVLGGKVPDFVNVNGKKKLIELYGDYWHRNQNPDDRINYFKTFGWDTLVVWENELKNEPDLKDKLMNFHFTLTKPRFLRGKESK